MADTPDLNQLTTLTTQQKASAVPFLQGQRQESQDFLGRFTGAINSQETSSAMAKRIGDELGLPTLQSNANLLRTTLNTLPSTYSKATTGYDVNANQLSRIIGQKASELAPAVDTAERALSTAQGNLNTRMGYEQTDQAKRLVPYQTEQSLLTDRLARESNMFSQDNERELNALIAKINAGVTLSEGEKNRANQLAIAEKGYQQAIELAKINKQQESPYAKLSAGEVLFNTNTGKPVYSAPYKPTTTGGSGGGIQSYYGGGSYGGGW